MRPLWTYTPDRTLSVDHRKALEELFQYDLHFSGKEKEVTVRSWEHGATTSFCRMVSLTEIPGGSSWRWSQTKSRVHLTNEDRSSILVAKLGPRKKGSGPKSPLPSYKLWVFTIKGICPTPFSVLWCERGSEPLERPPPQPSPPNSHSNPPSNHSEPLPNHPRSSLNSFPPNSGSPTNNHFPIVFISES